MKKSKTTSGKNDKPKAKKVVVKKIDGHKPTAAYLAALKAVAAMGKKDKKD